MNYWVAKGNPAYYDWDRKLRPGREENWHSRFPPQALQTGDRVFLWESGGPARVIGLAEVVKPIFKRDDDGQKVFRMRYLTNRLQWMAGLELLKTDSLLRDASFLKSGVYRTVYELTEQQGRRLYQIVIGRNPSDHIWRENGGPMSLPDVDQAALEGNAKLVAHLRRERNPSIARKKKDYFRQKHGKLFCEVCGSDLRLYGDRAESAFEVHHRAPLGKTEKEVKTTLADLAVVCSNCHRVVHSFDPIITVPRMSKLLKSVD